jgi:hypothetical protein
LLSIFRVLLPERIKNETLKFGKDIYSAYNTNPTNSTQSSVVTTASNLPPPLPNPGLVFGLYICALDLHHIDSLLSLYIV